MFLLLLLFAFSSAVGDDSLAPFPRSATEESPRVNCVSGLPSSCNSPPPPQKHGDWFCPSPPTCHLECDPGYVATNGTVATCHLGDWSSSSTCLAAVALITGGISSYNSVEIYGEGLHEKLPNLPDAKGRHTAHTVGAETLVCGGYYSASSCLVMTPSLQWLPHSDTTSPRDDHCGVSMLGRLHLLGGGHPSSSITTEILSPTSHEWQLGWDLLEDTYLACAVKVEPEVFISTGGYGHPGSVVAYNVTSGSATRLQDLTAPRSNHGCAYVKDPLTGFRGLVVAGGFIYVGATDLSELYDIGSGEWSETGKLSTGRYGVRMVVLGSNVLAMGGRNYNDVVASVERFNVTSREWTKVEEMMEGREWHAVTEVSRDALGIDQN